VVSVVAGAPHVGCRTSEFGVDVLQGINGPLSKRQLPVPVGWLPW
jgi:hypothetical protein